jgi:hypothetical protein
MNSTDVKHIEHFAARGSGSIVRSVPRIAPGQSPVLRSVRPVRANTRNFAMRTVRRLARCTLLPAIALLAAGSCIAADPADDPQIQQTLRAMSLVSTWWHPDIFGMTAGMRAYAHHQYPKALKYFSSGAYYADKLSQLSLGLMYANGEGTPKDPVTAYAWMELACERHYPQFEATRDRLKETLSPEQLAEAQRVRDELAKTYGDVVTKPRMAWQLKMSVMETTGSLTGFDWGVSQVRVVPCGPSLTIGGRTLPQPGCPGSDLNSAENKDPDLYFAARDREWKPSVTVGPLSEQQAPSNHPQPSEKSADGQSEPPQSH